MCPRDYTDRRYGMRRAAEGPESLVVAAVPTGLTAQAFSTGRHSAPRSRAGPAAASPACSRRAQATGRGWTGLADPRGSAFPRGGGGRMGHRGQALLSPTIVLSVGKLLSEEPTRPKDPRTRSAGTHWAGTPAPAPTGLRLIWQLRHRVEQRMAETHQGGGLDPLGLREDGDQPMALAAGGWR